MLLNDQRALTQIQLSMQMTLIYTNQVQKQMQYQIQEHLKMELLKWSKNKVLVFNNDKLKSIPFSSRKTNDVKASLSDQKVNLYSKSRLQNYLM